MVLRWRVCISRVLLPCCQAFQPLLPGLGELEGVQQGAQEGGGVSAAAL
jgi:hypothetical protein